MARRLFREERLQRISERLLAGKAVYVDELAHDFGVSPSSIRNDLAELEERGILTRTHGGAIGPGKLQGRLITQKSPFELRRGAQQAEKEAIGQAAAGLVEDGDTLMIDGGTTTLCVAHYLAGKRNLTIITTGATLLPALMTIPDARIYVAGGLLDRTFETLLGEMAVEMLGRFRTAKAILGIDGISVQSGLSVTDPAIAATKRQMMMVSDQVVVVSDSTKLGQICLAPLAPLEAISYLVTDSGAAPEFIEEIQAHGPQVIVAPVDPN